MLLSSETLYECADEIRDHMSGDNKKGPAVGLAVTETSRTAVWNVSHTDQWSHLVDVTLLLAEGVWDSDQVAPSANNIAVIFGRPAEG
jgi:hypothetical protein